MVGGGFSLLCICFVFSHLFLVSSLPDNRSAIITLSLSQFAKNPSPDPWKKLTHLVSTSLTRAHHIKNPLHSSLSKAPLSSHSYGGYSISLSFGTPPQTIPFIMDTGSSLVWFPCTHRYLCKNCSFPNTDPTKIPSFIPKLSSSSQILGCANSKCSWIQGGDVKSRCRDCAPNSSNCSQICPPYVVMYGSGTTGGILLSETLDLSSKKIPNFVVGCSLFSSHQPAGIAGFGRGPQSLPSQLGLKKFSYCLLSRHFDDTSESSSLTLDGGSDSGAKTSGVGYTPFLKNPVAGKAAFSEYYYVSLRKITVGGKRVKIPYRYISPGSDGNGGTVVDSGTTFTFMEGAVFELVASEFERQVAHYKRAKDVEARTGLRPCFGVSDLGTISLPELAFHFKGGAKMALPLANYFFIPGNADVVCLTILTDAVADPASSGGPAIILGSFQQQNFQVEYDLANERFGFRQQVCK